MTLIAFIPHNVISITLSSISCEKWSRFLHACEQRSSKANSNWVGRNIFYGGIFINDRGIRLQKRALGSWSVNKIEIGNRTPHVPFCRLFFHWAIWYANLNSYQHSPSSFNISCKTCSQDPFKYLLDPKDAFLSLDCPKWTARIAIRGKAWAYGWEQNWGHVQQLCKRENCNCGHT